MVPLPPFTDPIPANASIVPVKVFWVEYVAIRPAEPPPAAFMAPARRPATTIMRSPHRARLDPHQNQPDATMVGDLSFLRDLTQFLVRVLALLSRGVLPRNCHCCLELHLCGTSTPLGVPAAARIIHKNVADSLRIQGKELHPAFTVDVMSNRENSSFPKSSIACSMSRSSMQS